MIPSELRDCVVLEADTLKNAVAKLSSNRKQIVLVLDTENKVIGSITDGDVRRALLQNKTMGSQVSQIMRSDPTTLLAGSSDGAVRNLMISKQLEHIPLVDDQNRLVGLRTLRDLTLQPRVKNPVLLMAGGFGKRLLPLTAETPKPMLKIGSRPMLEIILQQFLDVGFSEFVISTFYKAEMIKEYFGDGSNWGANITYVQEQEQLGTGGALALLPQIDAPMIVTNGDVISSVNFAELLDFHMKQEGRATMVVRDYSIQVPFGVVESDGLKVRSIVEKPEYRYFINAGIYVLDPDVVNARNTPVHVDMPDLLRDLVSDGSSVAMYPLHESWADVGHHSELVAVRDQYDK